MEITIKTASGAKRLMGPHSEPIDPLDLTPVLQVDLERPDVIVRCGVTMTVVDRRADLRIETYYTAADLVDLLAAAPLEMQERFMKAITDQMEAPPAN